MQSIKATEADRKGAERLRTALACSPYNYYNGTITVDKVQITCSAVRRQAIPMEQGKVLPSVTLYSLNPPLPSLV